MISLLGTFIDVSLESAINNPWPAIAASIALLLLLCKLVILIRKRYLISYPFIMSFYDKNPFSNSEVSRIKKKIIEGVHGLFPDKIIMEVCLKQQLTFEQINIRPVQRKCFSSKYFSWRFLKPVFWYWENAREGRIRVEGITDLSIVNSPESLKSGFWDQDDLRGGRDGYYRPSCSWPKGGYLLYEIKLGISPNLDRWDGYISFKHYRGGSHRPCVRGRLAIKNTNLETEENHKSPQSRSVILATIAGVTLNV